MKGLIVKKHFIDMILDGKKRVEIRTRRTRYRGPVLLIWKGRGYGVVEIVGVEELYERDLSREERKFLERYGDRKLFAWILRNPRRLREPVRVKVPRGAQIWVRLDEETKRRVRELLDK